MQNARGNSRGEGNTEGRQMPFLWRQDDRTGQQKEQELWSQAGACGIFSRTGRPASRSLAPLENGTHDALLPRLLSWQKSPLSAGLGTLCRGDCAPDTVPRSWHGYGYSS